MKKWTIAFWSTTGLFCLMMTGSATLYFVSEEVAKVFSNLGFPSYFRVELGIAKYLGVIVLLLPNLPKNVKEWAYAGFGITLISAVIAHVGIGDPIDKILAPIVAFCLMSGSYISRNKMDL